jgi:hypothetical protein
MLLFLENNIRGGVSFIGQRWCETQSQPVNTDPDALTGGDKLLYIDAVRRERNVNMAKSAVITSSLLPRIICMGTVNRAACR